MTFRVMFTRLIFSGLVMVAAFETRLLAQTNAPGPAAAKDASTVSPGSATPNTNTNPVKHRYWRHRGGRHPHFGSRRVRI